MVLTAVWSTTVVSFITRFLQRSISVGGGKPFLILVLLNSASISWKDWVGDPVFKSMKPWWSGSLSLWSYYFGDNVVMMLCVWCHGWRDMRQSHGCWKVPIVWNYLIWLTFNCKQIKWAVFSGAPKSLASKQERELAKVIINKNVLLAFKVEIVHCHFPPGTLWNVMRLLGRPVILDAFLASQGVVFDVGINQITCYV